MKPEEKKELAAALLEAMLKENLHNRETGACLNIRPDYISMMKNEKLWQSVPQKAWTRVEEWMNTRGRLKDFVIPEGEELLPKKVPAKVTETMTELGPTEEKAFLEGQGPEEHSPEAVMNKDEIASSQAPRNDRGRKAKKEKNGRSVVLELNKAQMEHMEHRVAFMEQKVIELQDTNKACFESVQALSARIASMEYLNEQLDKSMEYLNEQLDKRIEQLEKPKEPEAPRDKIVIFQRNIFKR